MSDPEHITSSTWISLGGLVSVLAGIFAGARSYGKLETAQGDLKERVERCEATHQTAGEKLDNAAAALNKMSGTLDAVCRSVERVHERLDELR